MSDAGFCIDLNDKFTRVCDITQKGPKVELDTVGYAETAPLFFSQERNKVIEDQALVLTNLVTNLRIKKKLVHIVIPDTYAFSQIVEMPKLKEKELLAAIRYQADEFIPMDIDETSIDLEILREDPVAKKLLILIVASPKKIIEKIEKVCEAAHLIPDSLETEISAAGRLFTSILSLKGSKSVVINFGYYTTTLYLVDPESSLIIFSRTFKIGLDLFVKDMRANLSWEDKKIYEALKSIGFTQNASVDLGKLFAPIMKEFANELQKFLVLARDHYNISIEQLFIYNADTYINQLNQALTTSISLPVGALPIQNYLLPTPATTAFQTELSSLVSGIGGDLQ
ncbi:pilus assembly protein PilM [Candidatus Roizmanbacteria bacterium]|nr:pilus assembly protein PilM [Candidatus Roizmanbacteria bacterium]